MSDSHQSYVDESVQAGTKEHEKFKETIRKLLGTTATLVFIVGLSIWIISGFDWESEKISAVKVVEKYVPRAEELRYALSQEGTEGATIRPECFEARILRYAPKAFLAIEITYRYDPDDEGPQQSRAYKTRFHSVEYKYDLESQQYWFVGKWSQEMPKRSGTWRLRERSGSSEIRPIFVGWVKATQELDVSYHQELYPAPKPCYWFRRK